MRGAALTDGAMHMAKLEKEYSLGEGREGGILGRECRKKAWEFSGDKC